MSNLSRFQLPVSLRRIAGAILSFVFLSGSTTVLAHGGHGDEFQDSNIARQPSNAIRVDAQTARRLGIKVETATRRSVDVGIKTTGQIETLPSKKVEVTAPIPGKVVELAVEPGASVKAGQPVAVLAAPEIVQLRVESQEKRAEARADLQQARADLRLAQQNLERQRQIAAADIEQARTEVRVAQERYDRDKELENAGALPRREMLESQAHLAEGRTAFVKAIARREVIEAENQLKRAQANVEVAQTHLRLSQTTYQTRLQQLGTQADAKGLVRVTAPISGTVADREVTLGQAFEEAGGQLMTIVDDSRVFATANIYEKDLDKVKVGQWVNLKVASLPEPIFTGRIKRMGSVVEGEARVVPVQAEIDNAKGLLKPGMFAELEIVTDQTSSTLLAIPNSAVVEANGNNLVYVQNGNAFQPVEVTLGQTSGDWVEVRSGLFEGDAVVTQRAPQLYAQSLRGGSQSKEAGVDREVPLQGTTVDANSLPLPWWLIGAGGGAIATVAFLAGRRTRSVTAGNSDSNPNAYETKTYLDNCKQPSFSQSAHLAERQENSQEGQRP